MPEIRMIPVDLIDPHPHNPRRDLAALAEALAEALAVRAERDALAAKVEAVRALHYAADNDAARTPICETCHGKAGVHECGCWADRDREPVCGHCREGHKGMSVAWPCPTLRALDGRADAPTCTCPEAAGERETAYTVADSRLEPHSVGCPRWGRPRADA